MSALEQAFKMDFFPGEPKSLPMTTGGIPRWVDEQVRQARTPIGRLFQPVQQIGHNQSNLVYLKRKLSDCPEQIQEAVQIDARVKHGNPVFRGTRIPVYLIIEELAGGTHLEELIDGYPSLSQDKIQAGLDFAARLLRVYDD